MSPINWLRSFPLLGIWAVVLQLKETASRGFYFYPKSAIETKFPPPNAGPLSFSPTRVVMYLASTLRAAGHPLHEAVYTKLLGSGTR